ncbi:hypothetical protein [Azospira restricta]|uniref:Uncharacterized protein n=1 Tax=Azospira restricta TaxID=404405 RepID=A0A974SNF6_9RHOO|nr:hypothetical protein [Azospira restricta]QRJ63532.1 hypothetical protein IWH25_17610 [Azospira restricta]
MNNEIQKIRDEFLAQACRYLFGAAANCHAFRPLDFGLPALQPIPVTNRGCQR